MSAHFDLESKGFQLLASGKKYNVFANPEMARIVLVDQTDEKRGAILSIEASARFMLALNTLMDLGFTKEESGDMYSEKVFGWAEEGQKSPCDCPSCKPEKTPENTFKLRTDIGSGDVPFRIGGLYNPGN